MRLLTASTRSGSCFVAVLAAVVAAGCAHSTSGGAREVTLAEFAQPAPADPDEGTVQPVVARARDDSIPDEPFEFAEPDEFSDRSILRPTRPGETVVVDSLVGHVNGRPIFADDFLEPIEDRLLRAAEEKYGVEQQVEFSRIINERLWRVVTNELLLAEAESSLSTDEQRGLFAWLRMMYDEEIRRGGGTRTGAERRLQQSGEDLDEYLGEQKEMVLIHQLQQQKIEPRVIVSWRDIEREYQRRYAEFNPPATVTLARIRLSPVSQPALVDDVARRLAAGESFAEIADELGFADGGVWETFEMGPGGITDIEVAEEMKQALAGLEQGDTSAPFELGSGVLWLHVVEVRRPAARSIYDPQVQLRLRNSIFGRRRYTELNRYINSLLERGVYDELEDMADRLHRIAMLRYGT
jgi:hypothetical protein